MSFNILTNAHTFKFNYRALMDVTEWAGSVACTNSNTAPEIFGSFLGTVPTCPIGNSLVTIRDWQNSTNGKQIRFSYFKNAPFTGGNYRVTGEIADALGNLKLQFWQLKSSIWVKQPYSIKSAIPVSTTTSGITISPSNKLVGGTIGQAVAVEFGFKIVPVEPKIVYNRYSIEEIPWITVPAKGLDYTYT